MLTLREVGMSYGGRTLFAGVSLQVNRGERIGLVGTNGSGKTTLFGLMLGEQSPDEGEVVREKGATLGFLPQENAPAGDETVIGLVIKHGGEAAWELEPKAKSILRALSFRDDDFERPTRALSGGWVMRAHLARLLVEEPDLLLLDEPTNHLDLESLVWLQDYLKHKYPGAILMISHDREFLNQLVGEIVEIAHQRLHRYRGNFDAYLREKEARQARHAAAYENQQKEIARLQALADRFRAKASKAAMAQSKLRQIEQMEKIEAPFSPGKTVKIRFPQPPRSGRRVVTLRDVSFAYPTGDGHGGAPGHEADGTRASAKRTVVYRGLNFEAERGQRIVLVGPNGAGKSTLIKLLAGVLTPDGGVREVGLCVRIGYSSQYRADMLDGNRSVLEEALAVERRPPEQLARTLLGAFLFRGDDVFKPVGVLSGGEKTRLALAKMLLDPPNLLLMDEPTTHLDIESIDALVAALRSYEGTFIFISHDVYFIRAMATTVLHISAGQLTPYAGNYDYYLYRTQPVSERAGLTAGTGLADDRPPQAPNESSAAGRKIFLTRDEKRAAAQARETAARERRQREEHIAHMETEIARLESVIQELADELEKPETYEKGGHAMQLNRELLAVQADVERLTADWERAVADIEALP